MIYIWLRETVDWSDEDAVMAQVPDRFRPRLELWNSTFDMPYHLFRDRLREIAALNLSRVENGVHADWDEIPDGARVVPVGDDDWFAPGATRAVEAELEPEATGYLWPSRWIELPFDFGHRLYLLLRERAIGRGQLVRKYRRHRRLYERPLPPDLEWCRPYVAMMAELMDDLKPR